MTKKDYFDDILGSIDRFNKEFHIGEKDEDEFFKKLEKADPNFYKEQKVEKKEIKKVDDKIKKVKKEENKKSSFFVSKKKKGAKNV